MDTTNGRLDRPVNRSTARLTRRRLVRLTAAGAGALALGGLAACAPDAPATPGGSAAPIAAGTQPPAGPVRGGRLRVLAPADISPRIMVDALSPVNVWVLGGVYDTLTRYRLDRLEARPVLAESWTFSPDFRQLTFKLRGGVTFHGGRPFTSADVQWNIERVADPKSASQLLNFGKWVTRMETPDATTLVIHFDAPRPSALDLFESLFVADRESYADLRAGKKFVGTGPFTLKEWIPGDGYTLARNASYWDRERPYLDEVSVKVVPDKQTQLISLQTGNADVATNVEQRDLKALSGDRKYQVAVSPVWGTKWGMGFDVKAFPFADKRARQAIAYLVDRKRIIDTLLPLEEPIQLPWPKSSPAYFGDLASRYGYDQAKAKALWEQASGGRAVELPISVSLAYPETHGIAELVQAELGKLGVKAAIEKLEPAQYSQRLSGAKFNGIWIGLFAWVNKTPSTLFVQSFAYRVPNAQNFDSAEYREIIGKTLSTTDAAELAKVYRRLDEILLDESFVVPIASANRPIATTAAVGGLTLTRDTVPLVGELWKSA